MNPNAGQQAMAEQNSLGQHMTAGKGTSRLRLKETCYSYPSSFQNSLGKIHSFPNR